MKLEDFRLCIRSGDGLVARFDTAVLVVTASNWVGMPAIDQLLEECQMATAQTSLPRRLALLVDEYGPQKVPAFCAIGEEGDDLAMFVHGDSQVVITGAQPVMRLSGGGTGRWTGGIHGGVASLIVGPATNIPELTSLDEHFDLRDGIVPGAAILLVPRDHVASPSLVALTAVEVGRDDPTPVAAADVVRPEPPVDVPAPAPTVSGPTMSLPAPQVSPPLVPAAALDGPAPMVWGIHCKRGHFNNPNARYCRMCGTHMVHQRRDPVLGPRPVLGFLIVDDGSTYKLDADYVIGRAPEADSSVQAGEARGLGLSDPEDTVSPVHAAIRLDKWDVFVTDLSSRYGTHVWTPGTSGWLRLDPGQTAMLEPRTHLLFGRRSMVFDSANHR